LIAPLVIVLALALSGEAPPEDPEPPLLEPAAAASVAAVADADPALAASATPEPVPATTVAPAPPPAPVAPPPRPSLGGWRHAFAVGGQVNWLVSNEDSRYQFRSASFGYHGSVGARGAFLDLAYLVPLQARQDGATYTTGDYYRTRAGLDLLVGFNWRWALPRDLEAEAGPGLHATVIYLPGKDNYRDFTASPLGLGASGTFSWRTGKRWLSRAVTLGGSLAAAWDFTDPAHAGDLAHGWTIRFALTVGLGGRT
jgi:hypothetical protein